MSIRRVRNTTGASIFVTDTGVTLAAGETFTIDPMNYRAWAASNDKNAYLASGAIVVNDGSRDLAESVGKTCLDDAIAFKLGFESDPERVNGFISKTVQEAIEEAMSVGIAAGNCLVLGFDGNTSTGRWMEFVTNTPSDASPLVVPRSAKIRHLSLSVNSTSTVTFAVFKNAVSVATISITSARTGYNNHNVSLAPGDKLNCQCTAGSCSKPIIGIWF